jgi:hypothetical protein
MRERPVYYQVEFATYSRSLYILCEPEKEEEKKQHPEDSPTTHFGQFVHVDNHTQRSTHTHTKKDEKNLFRVELWSFSGEKALMRARAYLVQEVDIKPNA